MQTTVVVAALFKFPAKTGCKHRILRVGLLLAPLACPSPLPPSTQTTNLLQQGGQTGYFIAISHINSYFRACEL